MDLGNFNPQDLQKYIEGVNFPANKDEVVKGAQDNNADQGMIDQLKNNLDPGQYGSPQEVLSNIQG